MKLHAITRSTVIFTGADGRIIVKPINSDAQAILDYYYTLPANNY